ncbi:MAG: hypothetical protein H7A04_15905 [Pseudomonadales bacterium]|nr:hypothetical protein [Pseudomonadales bacterium]MCP5348340.1 hypothetical protein [Pseudomonadales bacterium]
MRFELGDIDVLVAEQDFEAGGDSYPAGTLLIDMDGVDRELVSDVLSRSRLQVDSLRNMPDVATHELDLPRLAVFQTWASTQNAGWVRYSLDQAGIPYTLISKDRARAGALRGEFDVILAPHMSPGTSIGGIMGGVDPKWSPLAYETSDQTPNLGHILSSDDITGGIGFEGMNNIEAFIRTGGTLITLGSAVVIASDSGILRGINKIGAGGMNTPGSILTAKITDSSSSLTYGYDEITHVFCGNGPIFSVPYYDRDLSPMQFGTKPLEDENEEESDDGENDEGEEEAEEQNKTNQIRP